MTTYIHKTIQQLYTRHNDVLQVDTKYVLMCVGMHGSQSNIYRAGGGNTWNRTYY